VNNLLENRTKTYTSGTAAAPAPTLLYLDPVPPGRYSGRVQPLGNYIDGAFVPPTGQPLVSRNPAAEGAVVLETGWNLEAVEVACEAAAHAARAWSRRSLSQRADHLGRFRDALASRAQDLADAIVWETGKLRSEARAEVQTVLARFELARQAIAGDLKEGPLPGFPHEHLRYHPHGVVAVIGPYNFPLHLCHAYVVPALLLGNTVVVKPSDISPLVGQRYAECADAAGLPPGVLNVVLGTGAVGAALVAHRHVRGLAFTGSWAVGRRISEAALDRPELLVALEMGGKNTSIVLEDASLRQAVHEIVVGGYLSAGQRCTCTDRVLVHRRIAGPFVEALRACAAELRFGHPDDPASFAGPLATEAARDKFEGCVAAARAAGAEVVVDGARLPGGSYHAATLHRLPDGVHAVAGYTDVEVFGPDLCIEIVDDDAEAIAVLNASPYGFANAVFTASDDRFDRIYRDTHAGILNRNRSTNLASPRLPFGGVGRSGNHRPAGAFTHRNMIVPVAVLENPIGSVPTPHPMLGDRLPAPDLDRIERGHHADDEVEASRFLVDHPRPMRIERPAGGALPRSEAWLGRLYAGDRVVKEKKPAVFDHLRSSGPWFVSVDDAPLSVLDGMSQTATLCGGFAEDPVVRAYVEGEFADTLIDNADTAVAETRHAADYAATLRHLVPGLPHVTFVASGAEANEKAIALCRINASRPAATKVLAFEGSFHGRTLLALHATHSPSKRTPFELAGYEATFAPFPVWDEPGEEPAAPSGFYAAAAAGELGELLDRFGDTDDDPLLAAELRALDVVHRALGTGEYACVIVEPMQSEGGDRYASERFFRALRLLTRRHDTFLVFDEVQTGFGLGGPFAWHSRFRLLNQRGQPDYPDAVTFAKRAQVGVVMSRFDDPEPASAHNASLIRGRLHAEMMSTSHAAARIEKLVRPRLAALAAAFPHLVASPRACGYAFAFDLPGAADLDAFLGQRFWRGAIVFGAGSRTARYRLSESFLAREIDLLFEAIRRSLSWLDAHPGGKPKVWEDVQDRPGRAEPITPAGLRFRSVQPAEAATLLPAILDIEYQVYEPARRTPPAHIKAALEDPEASTIVAEMPHGDGDAWQLVAFAIGAPLEGSAETEGPDDDPMLGRHNTMYSLSITVAPGFQSAGIGRRLKELQLRDAMARRRPDGSPRYRYVTGRNRVGRTAQMTHLNRVFGAHVVSILTGQYEDPEGQAIYYRIPVLGIAPDPALRTPAVGGAAGSLRDREIAARGAPRGLPEAPGAVELDAASGLTRPFATPPATLRDAEQRGLLYGPAVNKITLMNYVTPAAVRALEWIAALAPDLPHLYLTSSRDETIDKAVRLLRCSRKQAEVAIGLDGGYYGHTVASCRSLSDPEVHGGGPGHFAWPRVPHPAVVGTEATVSAIRDAVAAAGGAERVLGFFYEVVQERTGRALPDGFCAALDGLRRQLDVPLVAVETTTSFYRSGLGAFVSTGRTGRAPTPDVLTWWGGGQTGYLHVAPRWLVSAPLALVSTWDGDELSLIRNHHQLRAARHVDVAAAADALTAALSGVRADGLGLYRVVDAGARWAEQIEALARRGVRVRALRGQRYAIAPSLDEAVAVATAVAEVVG
jgi:RHH-type transcriptional regulator, proline utilization regulon repressor / proline dehydrogenase / delta 1-pyrroline-5-carboxylate dehydrogenase